MTEFERMLEAVPSALVGVDQTGVIRYVNRQTESLFGYNRDDLVGELLETLVPESVRPKHPAHRDAYFAHLKLPRLDGDGPRGVGRLPCPRGRHSDGTEFMLSVTLTYIDTEDGPLAIAALHDLTARTKSERDLDLTRQLAAIVKHSNDAIIGATLDGEITSWNSGAERIYGYASGEIIGKSVELISPKDRTAETKAVLAKIRSGEHVDCFETRRVRKDGKAITVSLTVSPICDADGTTVGASSIARLTS
ncbi:MAG: PAS domain S-box protein [Dermatophilaceae bacterium]